MAVTRTLTGDTTREPSRRRPGRPRTWFAVRREEIIREAAKVFARKGYHATSITDLCRQLDMGRGALYHYIDSKEALLDAIHERFIAPLLQRARDIYNDGGPADVVLTNISRELMNTIAEYLDEVTVFLHEWKALVDTDEWEDVRRKRQEFEDIIERTIVRGQEDGVFRITDPRLTARTFLGMHNYTYQWYSRRGRHSAEELAALFSTIFLDGVRRVPRPEASGSSAINTEQPEK